MTWVRFCGPGGRDAAGYGRQGCLPLQIGGSARMRPPQAEQWGIGVLE
jgi:hypothetical protein